MPNQSRQIRRNIRKMKRRAGKKMDKVQWYIAKRVNRKTFYVAEHDSSENTTMWSPKRRESISFLTERAAHNFLKCYLHDRNDVILVNLITKDAK